MRRVRIYLVHEPTRALLRLPPSILTARTERGKDGMIVLDYRDNRSLYEQVAERLRELMFKEALPQDTQLPSVRSLTTEPSISPSTIQRTYTELECQGYVYSIKDRGSFVAGNSRMKARTVRKWKGRFKAAVEEGVRAGAVTGEMKEVIDMACRSRVAGRGGSNDWSNELDETV